MKLSIVLPVLDADAQLAGQIHSLEQVLRSIAPGGELIVAGTGIGQFLPPEGGSHQDSANTIPWLPPSGGRGMVQAVDHPERSWLPPLGGRNMVRPIEAAELGFGPAPRAGLQAARAGYVVTLYASPMH